MADPFAGRSPHDRSPSRASHARRRGHSAGTGSSRRWPTNGSWDRRASIRRTGLLRGLWGGCPRRTGRLKTRWRPRRSMLPYHRVSRAPRTGAKPTTPSHVPTTAAHSMPSGSRRGSGPRRPTAAPHARLARERSGRHRRPHRDHGPRHHRDRLSRQARRPRGLVGTPTPRHQATAASEEPSARSVGEGRGPCARVGEWRSGLRRDLEGGPPDHGSRTYLDAEASSGWAGSGSFACAIGGCRLTSNPSRAARTSHHSRDIIHRLGGCPCYNPP